MSELFMHNHTELLPLVIHVPSHLVLFFFFTCLCISSVGAMKDGRSSYLVSDV